MCAKQSTLNTPSHGSQVTDVMELPETAEATEDTATVMSIRIPKHVRTLQPYRAGKPISELAREQGLSRIVKLASNENSLGPSPLASSAAKQAAEESHRYVDPSAFDLTTALSKKLNVPQNNIVTGAGTDSLLAYIIQTFSEQGDEVLTGSGTFIGIFVNTNKLQRKLVTVPLRADYGFDIDGIIDAVSEKTRIIYIASPNNPTGAIVTKTELEHLLEGVPKDILIILDEAYFSYAESFEEYPNGLHYQRENLIITRTFSKDFGLAGLRVGFAVGPEELISQLYKVKLPFEPSLPAQMAAIAALADSDHLQQTLTVNRESLRLLVSGLGRIGIRVIPSLGNFVLAILPNADTAQQVCEVCLTKGLILRQTDGFGVPEGIRISTGTVEETKIAIEILTEVCEGILVEIN